MNRSITAIAMTLALTLGMGAASFAADHSMGHGSPAADHGSMAGMDHSKHLGTLIKESKLDKGMFSYHLIDNDAQMQKAMQDGMKMDHKMEMKPNHLMLYPMGTDGQTIKGAKVGFMITGPAKEVQQVMAMEMEGGYGADVALKARGKYEVKMKLVKGDIQVVDTFAYEAK